MQSSAPNHDIEAVDTVDVGDGPSHPYWSVETSLFQIRWPDGFTVESPQDPDDATPFYLHGPSGSVIFVQGPVPNDLLAASDALVAPDQTVLARRALADGSTVIELTYEYAGEPWWQAHWTMPYDDARMVVVTAQGRVDRKRSHWSGGKFRVASPGPPSVRTDHGGGHESFA